MMDAMDIDQEVESPKSHSVEEAGETESLIKKPVPESGRVADAGGRFLQDSDDIVVKRTSTGFRISLVDGWENGLGEENESQIPRDGVVPLSENAEVIVSDSLHGLESEPLAKHESESIHEAKTEIQVKEEPDASVEDSDSIKGNDPVTGCIEDKSIKVEVKEEVPENETPCTIPSDTETKKETIDVKEEQPDLIGEINVSPQNDEMESKNQKLTDFGRVSVKQEVHEEPDTPDVQIIENPKPFLEKKAVEVKKEIPKEIRINGILVETGDFPVAKEWFLVGRSLVTATSTSKGRKLVDNEVVYFSFPLMNRISKKQFIVRFYTKRCGEIGRLPMEWSRWIASLVQSKKVKVLGRCVAAPANLQIMQDIVLYVSFYINSSIFTDCEKITWNIGSPTNIDSTIQPLLELFKHLEIRPYQNAEFTPQELNSRKRLLDLESAEDEAVGMLSIEKRRRGCPHNPERSKDEQVVSESSLNKMVGSADIYNLEEMEPPSTLMCTLKPYQKEALYWMSESEDGIDVDKAAETLHPCWAAYRICDERAPSIYVNIFSGEATTHFPTATMMARGGILADAMGLGKTVMTIALILARLKRGSSGSDDVLPTTVASENERTRRKDSNPKPSLKAKGGTLVVCPMALLSQWKDEIITHSEPGTVSMLIYYGGDRTSDTKVIADYDVVLTTYGVLTSSYKQDKENSAFYNVDWYRVVLDEAHTIKSWKTIGARAAFELSSHTRWCLTGTPIQNNLEDIYSLLCFLHVEPWCNWAWWNKLIQKPYDSGDPRGLKLIKAILRPLMLRRTKETKDKLGRPILVLPPSDVQVIECEHSEAEHDFYYALYKRSKVQFDRFVAQGKVLHNYANILELLLRLRQCCNHPYLVMSRADSQQYTDLDKLAKKFLEKHSSSGSQNHRAPSRAYVEEVIDGIRKGENKECPICFESADDPVLTPCAHRMCRECLLASWRVPARGLCPICRTYLTKTELFSCPTESKFRIDVEKNWTESSKILKLLECLEGIRTSGSGEKSIVFSQWTSFLDLLEIPLRKRGFGFLRFDGRLQQKTRERVLREFNETTTKTVLLMSLKAGGVGLNLTAASNVFLLDPWWNPAVEEQAIMRIHRIGQKRTVMVRRFIVKDTVEERMQQVQARKQRMIAGALTDEEVRIARLEELKMLFR